MAHMFKAPPWLTAALILASGGGIVALAAQAATDSPGAVYWSDGDSGRLPDGTKFRLHGVDSPETGSMKQRGGAKCELERIKGYEAKEAAVELTREKSARIAKSYGPDRYGRLVVDLQVGGKPDWCAAQARVPVAVVG